MNQRKTKRTPRAKRARADVRDPFRLIIPNAKARVEFSVMPLDLEAIADEAIQVLCEKLADAEKERCELIESLQKMCDAFSPDLYRVAAAAHGRADVADEAHQHARDVIARMKAQRL